MKPRAAPRVERLSPAPIIEGEDHVIKKGLTALALAVALPGLAAELPIPDIAFQKFTLDNGGMALGDAATGSGDAGRFFEDQPCPCAAFQPHEIQYMTRY